MILKGNKSTSFLLICTVTTPSQFSVLSATLHCIKQSDFWGSAFLEHNVVILSPYAA